MDNTMKRLSLVLMVLFLAGVAGAQTGTVDSGPSSPCHDGAVWHYKQASHWFNHEDQVWHNQAGDALVKLDGLGADCSGWDQDATRPGYDGSNDAYSHDKLQADSVVASQGKVSS